MIARIGPDTNEIFLLENEKCKIVVCMSDSLSVCMKMEMLNLL